MYTYSHSTVLYCVDENPIHLLKRSSHLERAGAALRKQNKVTKITFNKGGLYLHYKEKGETDWKLVEEKELILKEKREKGEKEKEKKNDAGDADNEDNAT